MSETPDGYLEILQRVLGLLSDRIPVSEAELAEAKQALDDLRRWCDAESTASAINFEKWREANDKLHDAWREIEALYTLVPLG